MTTPTARRVRLLEALYATFGEAADWTPAGGGDVTPVTVRPHTTDAIVNFGAADTIVAQNMLKVRVADVALPVKGDQAVLETQTFKVIAEPKRVHSGLEWLCEVKPV